jgi:hypothetical protein
MAPCPSVGRGEGVGEEVGGGVVTDVGEEVATGAADGVDAEDAVARGEGGGTGEQPTTKAAVSSNAMARWTRVARPRGGETWEFMMPSPVGNPSRTADDCGGSIGPLRATVAPDDRAGQPTIADE